jgi:uncharacterized membrane protein
MLGLLSFIPGAQFIIPIWKILTSRLGIAVMCLIFGFWKGYGYANSQAQIADLMAKNAALKADIEIALQQEKLADSQNAELQTIISQNQEKVDALLADLAKRPSRDNCKLSDDDARSLRGIR